MSSGKGSKQTVEAVEDDMEYQILVLQGKEDEARKMRELKMLRAQNEIDEADNRRLRAEIKQGKEDLKNYGKKK